MGDNVGDVAGMGADLFDSNVAAMASALVIAQSLSGTGFNNVSMVFCYAILGLFASIIGIATARVGKKGPTSALNSSTYVTTAIYLVLTAIATALFPGFSWRIWGAAAVGLLVGVIIGITTDYFTDDTKPIVQKVAHASSSGPAFTVLSGISYGFISALPAMVGIAVSALVAYKLCEPMGEGYAIFGISMAAVGMLSIVGMIISNDAYGPIVDNARGLAEMGGLGEETIRTADELDSAGNTVKAVTKGFSISAAGLTVISLLGAFMSEANNALAAAGRELITGFDIMSPTVFFGVLVGAVVPAVFSAMLILGVDKNAQRMVAEIHRQFNTIKGLREGKPGVKPEYDKCIDIATSGSLRELIPAGLMTIIATIIVGFIGGPSAIGGFLLGNIVSGLLLALFMSNAGGLWDNTKKYIEAGAEGGKAVADILYGKVSPSGRLPVTFYHNDSELPRFTDYSMKGRTYKYFQGKPLYPFAHGLSYTEFAYENLAFDGANVTGTVKNTGAMASGHAIPVFVKDPEEEGVNCRLAGFARVELEPGQEAGFQVELCPEILSLFQEPQRLVALVGGVDGCQVNQ